MSWVPGAWILARSETMLRLVVRTGRQTNCGGIAQITVRGELSTPPCAVVDECTKEGTLDLRERALDSLRETVEPSLGIRVVLEDVDDHPVDSRGSQYANAGEWAAAILTAWARDPGAPNDDIVAPSSPRPASLS